MRVGHDGSGPGAGWFLDHIEIDIPSRGENYMFAAHRWLAEDEEDGELEIELQPSNFKQSKPRKLKESFNNVKSEMHGPICYQCMSVIWCNIVALKKLPFKMIKKCIKNVKIIFPNRQ